MTILERLGLYAIIAGVIIIIAGGIYGRYEWVLRENEKAKERLVQSQEQTKQAAAIATENKAQFDLLQKRFDNLDKITAERNQREQKMQKSIDGIRKDLHDLNAKDPVVQHWSEQPVPDAISERLRSNATAPAQSGSAPQSQSPGKPDGKVPGTGVGGKIKRGLVHLFPAAKAPAPRVQSAAG